MTQVETTPLPCPKCGNVGLRDWDEWFCLPCGSYGHQLYPWDSRGQIGDIDRDEIAKGKGSSMRRDAIPPSVPWTATEHYEWATWEEGDPLPDRLFTTGEQRLQQMQNHRVRRMVRVVQLRAQGYSASQMARRLGVKQSVIWEDLGLLSRIERRQS